MRGLRSEKNMVTAVGRGFDSRHLHHLRGGVSLLVARTYVCRVRRTLAPPFRYRTRFMVSRFIVHRAFPVAFHHRLWYH